MPLEAANIQCIVLKTCDLCQWSTWMYYHYITTSTRQNTNQLSNPANNNLTIIGLMHISTVPQYQNFSGLAVACTTAM